MSDTQLHGWGACAAVLLLIGGVFNIIQGWLALATPEYYLVPPDGMLFWNFSAWGAILVIWGALLLVAGIAAFAQRMWARVLGTVLASVGVIVQLAFLVAFPLWSVVMIAIHVMVIYGMTAGWPESETAPPAYRAGRSDARSAPTGAHAMPQSGERETQDH